jgi:hypothetical protein
VGRKASLTDAVALADPAGVARQVAAFALPGVAGVPDPVAVPSEDWPTAQLRLRLDGLVGMAVAGYEAGWLRLSEDQVTPLLDLHQGDMAWALHVERELLTLSRAFQEADVELVVLKGPAAAHTFYPDPSWRSFGDLDLMVRSRDWERTCRLLAERGLKRHLPELRAGFDRRFGKEAIHRTGRGLEVDLHRLLDLGPFGLWMDPDELLDRAVPFSLGGRRFLRLDDTAALLHACIHATLQRDRFLSKLRDVAQIAYKGRIQWEVLEDWAGRWKQAAVIRRAFELVEEHLGMPPPDGARPCLVRMISRGERRALDAYTTDRRARGGIYLSSVQAIPGLRDKAAFVRALLLPSREFLAAWAANGKRPSYVRHSATLIRWILTGRKVI